MTNGVYLMTNGKVVKNKIEKMTNFQHERKYPNRSSRIQEDAVK